jgi:hypothetical protein
MFHTCLVIARLLVFSNSGDSLNVQLLQVQDNMLSANQQTYLWFTNNNGIIQHPLVHTHHESSKLAIKALLS